MRPTPLGTSGDLRRRLLLHHVPTAVASVLTLALFMGLPLFDAGRSPHPDIFSGAFPQPGSEHGSMLHGGDRGGAAVHGAGHGEARSGPTGHGERHATDPVVNPDQVRGRSVARQLTFATGYVAVGLVAVTLLIGPANLLLRRRNPVSNDLRRDVGTWAAIGSIAHVVLGFQVHGGGRRSALLEYFLAADGAPLVNSFGLANWTGLGALVIVAGLLAISSDAALRKLKARPWKRLQRLNYVLFALVVLHAVFYGALLRVTSPFTIVLGLCVLAVAVGQGLGVWLWKRRGVGLAPGVAGAQETHGRTYA